MNVDIKKVIIKGTAVVRKADGTIRYDEDAIPGEYHESEEDMKGIKDGADARNSSAG